MAQAITTPTSFKLIRKFEELPLFRSVHAGETFFSGLVDGEYEIDFDQSGEWSISDVWIRADNGRCGLAAAGRLVNIERFDDERFHWILLDAIEDCYNPQIEEAVGAELAWMNVRTAAA